MDEWTAWRGFPPDIRCATAPFRHGVFTPPGQPSAPHPLRVHPLRCGSGTDRTTNYKLSFRIGQTLRLGRLSDLLSTQQTQQHMTADPLKLFGRHLTWLRKQRGWSQEALSLESGLARSYLSGIERGTRNVALYNICALADTLGVAPTEMLDFSRHRSDEATAAPRSPFDSEQSPSVQATLRYMAELNDVDRDVVAGVARALARRHMR